MLYRIIIIFFFSFFISNCLYAKKAFIEELTTINNTIISDTIVVIIKKNQSEVRGILMGQNNKLIVVLLGKEEVIFFKNEISSFYFITSDEIKAKTIFETPNPNYTRYCFLPSAFTTEKGEASAFSHYFITSNLKLGITDNLEFSIGSIFINSIFSSFSYSTPLFESVRAAVSIYGGYVFFLPNSPNLNLNGVGIIPRISFGDEYQNITMGFLTAKTSFFPDWIFGGYLGGQQKLKERWTLAGEFIGLTIDAHNIILFGDVTMNFTRREYEIWSFGAGGINSNDQNINMFSNSFIPFPYFGYQRLF